MMPPLLPPRPPDEPPTVLPLDEPPLPVTGFWGAIGLCCLLVLIQIPFAIILGLIGAATGLIYVPEFLFGVYTVIMLLSSVAVARSADRGAVRRAVALRGCHPLQFVLAVLLAPPMMPLCGVVAALVSSAFGWNPLTPEPDLVMVARSPLFERVERLYEQLGQLPWVWALLFGSLGPAVSEELFVRGVLGLRLVARYGRIWGIALTSAIFGIAHIEPGHVAATFVAGLVLHGVYLATGSLLAPIALHASYNACWIVAAKWAVTTGRSLAELSDATTILAWLVMAAGATLAALALTLYRTRTRWILPDGVVWSPGHLSAEMPPASLAAVPITSRPGAVAPILAVVAYFGFALTVPFAAMGFGSSEAARARERGDELARAGDPEGAIAAYNDGLRLSPYDRYLLGNRGLAHLERRDFAAAIADLDRALAGGPAEVGWLRGRGFARQGLGQLDAAWEDYMAAVRLKPHDFHTRYLGGRILGERNDWAGAVIE